MIDQLVVSSTATNRLFVGRDSALTWLLQQAIVSRQRVCIFEECPWKRQEEQREAGGNENTMFVPRKLSLLNAYLSFPPRCDIIPTFAFEAMHFSFPTFSTTCPAPFVKSADVELGVEFLLSNIYPEKQGRMLVKIVQAISKSLQLNAIANRPNLQALHPLNVQMLFSLLNWRPARPRAKPRF